VNVSEFAGVLVPANEIVPAGVKTVPPVAVSCTLTVNVAVPPTTAVPATGEIVVVVAREFTSMLVVALLFFQLLEFALYCPLMVPFPLNPDGVKLTLQVELFEELWTRVHVSEGVKLTVRPVVEVLNFTVPWG
jgi:hypothetical protein